MTKIPKKGKFLVDVIAGARPNLMKVSPLIDALDKEVWAKVRFINTGQHSSELMFQNIAKSLQMRGADEEFKNVHGSGKKAGFPSFENCVLLRRQKRGRRRK